ncbi:hypothetical protein ACFLSW_06440, partial [Candidatus Bipolaricaulota bacterium]
MSGISHQHCIVIQYGQCTPGGVTPLPEHDVHSGGPPPGSAINAGGPSANPASPNAKPKKIPTTTIFLHIFTRLTSACYDEAVYGGQMFCVNTRLSPCFTV